MTRGLLIDHRLGSVRALTLLQVPEGWKGVLGLFLADEGGPIGRRSQPPRSRCIFAGAAAKAIESRLRERSLA